MNDCWSTEPKQHLSPREVLLVAHAHLILGIDQHKLASMFGVNQGRINEAITVIKDACERQRDIYRKRAKVVLGPEQPIN